MFLAGIIMIIFSISAEAAITTIALLGMLTIIMIAVNMSSEAEKKHRKK